MRTIRPLGTNQEAFALLWASRDSHRNQSDEGRKQDIKRRAGVGGLSHSCDGVLKTMSTSWEFGDVSPGRYPDFESKRNRRGAASSANHGGKKKKESKKKETVIPSSSSPSEAEGAIQQLVPVGLDAFAKDHVVMEEKDPLVVLEEYRQRKVTEEEEEVLQEGVSGPPPTQDLQELIDELVEASPPPALPDYLVCPYHICHLENRVSQNGWHYAKCKMFLCVLFCPEEKAPAYMRAVHEQVHSDILKMWKHLLYFCCQPPTLQQSRSEKNPDRLYLCCSKKKCKFFQWANFALSRRYKDWLERETRDSPPCTFPPPVPEMQTATRFAVWTQRDTPDLKEGWTHG